MTRLALTVEQDTNVSILLSSGGSADAVPMPFTPGGGAQTQPRIVWRDDGTGDATTWVEVMALLATLGPGVQIYVDQFEAVLHVTPVAAYEMNAASFFAPPGHGVEVNIDDGATLNELASLRGPVRLVGNSTAGENVLTFTAQQGAIDLWAFNMYEGASLVNSGTNPFATVQSSAEVLLLDGSAISGTTPCFAVKDGSELVLLVQDNDNSVVIQDNSVGGTGVLVIDEDGSLQVPPPTFSDVGVSLVHGALTTNASAGPTSFRPTSVNLKTGTRYYDTDVDALLEWNNSGAWQPVLTTTYDGPSTDATAPYALPTATNGVFPASGVPAPLQSLGIAKKGPGTIAFSYALTVRNPDLAATVHIFIAFSLTPDGGTTWVQQAGRSSATIPPNSYAVLADQRAFTGGAASVGVRLEYTSDGDLTTGGPVSGGTLLAAFGV